MIKRYNFEYGNGDAWMEEYVSGEYVRYDDIAPLLEWLQEKAKEWCEFNTDMFESRDGYAINHCGGELEAKLKEFIG